MNDKHVAAHAAGPSFQPHRESHASRQLRAATRTEHAAVESLPLMSALMSARVDTQVYAEVLRRQLRIHAGWERTQGEWLRRQPWRYRPRAPALHADLAALQVDASADAEVAAPAATDDATAWGMLYVVEGAALGGQVIARHVRRHCAGAAGALRHFAASPEQAWPRFQALLDHALPDAATHLRAVTGARAMFARFHAELAAPY